MIHQTLSHKQLMFATGKPREFLVLVKKSTLYIVIYSNSS